MYFMGQGRIERAGAGQELVLPLEGHHGSQFMILFRMFDFGEGASTLCVLQFL